MNFFYLQRDTMECGATCLRMIAKYYGHRYSRNAMNSLCNTSREGISLLDIVEAAKRIGFDATSFQITLSDLKEMSGPSVLHWDQEHFVVLYKIKGKHFYIADPAVGKSVFIEQEFLSHWITSAGSIEGIALFLKPGLNLTKPKAEKRNFERTFLWSYFKDYKSLFFQLIIGLGVGSLLQLIAPVLTQSIVDTGIHSRNLNFVCLILIAQSVLFLAGASIEFIRNWILLIIASRINMTMLTDFLIKLMKLPIAYFETKTKGDILQRMADQEKIEQFLTESMLSSIFYIVNLCLFNVLLFFYSRPIFVITLIANLAYSFWVFAFLRRRKQLNYQEYELSSKNQNAVIELMDGIKEIKLTNSERQKRWKWEKLRVKLFHFKVSNLALNQYQQAGTLFVNQTKNILVIFISVKGVIDGTMTLGEMIAVQYISGMVSSPVEQLINFVHTFQDAKISMERLLDIYQERDEEEIDEYTLTNIPKSKMITFRNVSFTYPGAGNEPTIKNLDLIIPAGQVTAIVGASGSGKTTLLKLLLRFFENNEGDIYVGDIRLKDLNHKVWRNACSAVLQDGFIFEDTIAHNIAVGDEKPDMQKLEQALFISNLVDFINGLPFGLETKIGTSSVGVSQGQRQRILIARAVYRNPAFLFFDEATNALDSRNEGEIVHKLNRFFVGRTVVIVAHRLSTVRHADQIIVLDKGRVIEQGDHKELTALGGCYYSLVQNQLEIGI